jgi:photosystem II stability/assembly factor-like uncharacterized protein
LKRIVLFAVCAIAVTAAAAEWHYLSGGRLSGISSVGSHVWAVGQDGLFFYSEDNGQHWRRVSPFTTRNLVDVEFWDQGLGLVTADGDMIYRTTDNGASWDSSYVQNSAGRVRFVTHDCIWLTVVGYGIRSMDAGKTWPFVVHYGRRPWFLDSLVGWNTSSYLDSVVCTTDGGVSWTAVGAVNTPVSPQSGDWCFGFRDTQNGICGWQCNTMSFNPVYLWGWSVTTDGGATWDSLTWHATRGVACDVGPGGRVCGVEARGWVVYEPSLYHRSAASEVQAFNDISAARGDRAWVCGDGSAIWSSSDFGMSWTREKPQSGASLLSVDLIDSLHGWTASSTWPARTTDGGRSWIPTAAGAPVWPVTDVLALDETTALVTGANGYYDPMNKVWDGEFALGRTADAGASWDTTNFTVFDYGQWPIGSSRFARVDRHIWHPGVWAPGGNSLRSTDDGMTWLDMDSLGHPSDWQEPFDIGFADTMHGWVIDSRGNIRRTTDGGDSWTIIATGLNLKRLKMATLSTGWAISDSELYKTTDGGATWDGGVVRSGLQAIAFSDSMHGAIVGKKGLILRTSDGGETWVWDESEFTSDFYDVFMLDSTHAWAVGQYGLVLGFGDWAIDVDEPHAREGPCTLVSAVVVRPNPCQGRATIEFSHPLVKSTLITLVDVAGRVAQAVPVLTGARFVELDLRSTPSGIYFVRAGSGSAILLVVLH